MVDLISAMHRCNLSCKPAKACICTLRLPPSLLNVKHFAPATKIIVQIVCSEELHGSLTFRYDIGTDQFANHSMATGFQ